MELTAKKAVELSIELWEWCAETGKEKKDWPEWEKNGGQYPRICDECFLCEYVEQTKQGKQGGDYCAFCPYYLEYDACAEFGMPYHMWRTASSGIDRKKYAKQFLEQLKTILKDMGAK